MELNLLTCEDFSKHVGTTFGLAFDEGADPQFEIELESCKVLGEAPPGFSRAPFSLIFEGPADRLVEQRMYWLSHPEMGELGIFIVPIAQKGDRISYEAIFS